MNIHEPKLTKRHLDRKVTSFLNRVLLKLPQVLSSPVVLVSAMLSKESTGVLIYRVAAALLSHLNASLSHQTLQSSDSFLTTHRHVETERQSPICPDSEHA